MLKKCLRLTLVWHIPLPYINTCILIFRNISKPFIQAVCTFNFAFWRSHIVLVKWIRQKSGTNIRYLRTGELNPLLQSILSNIFYISLLGANINHLQYVPVITRNYFPFPSGLKVPEGCKLKVAGEERTWSEGKTILFDDSFLHSATNSHPTDHRAVLLVDLWSPDLSTRAREGIRQVF